MAALRLVTASSENLDRARKGFALKFQDSLLKYFCCIAWQYRASLLEYDRAMVVLVIDKMDRAATKFDAEVDCRLMNAKPVIALTRKCGDKRRMDINHAILEIFQNQQMLKEAPHYDQ